MNLQANAKINLFLNVIGKRNDGYHDIETVFQSINLHDKISIREIPSGIKIHCSHPDIPLDQNNIAFKAAEKLIKSSKIDKGVEISIDKKIPIGSGLGGGSADAAATLIGINNIFDLGYSSSELMGVGAGLGADVPFCIMGGTAVGRGIGEILTPLPSLEDIWIVLVNPGFRVSTSWAYKKLNFKLTKSEKNVSILSKSIDNYVSGLDNLVTVSKHLYNIFESVVETEYPVIADLKKMLKSDKTLAILMTGSGPTLYGLMKDKASAVYLKDSLLNKVHFCTLTKTSNSGIKIN